MDSLSHKIDWENFQQSNESVAFNVLFSLQNNEDIKIVYKSEHIFKRENKVLLLMINDDDNQKYYYFAVKSKLELYSNEWLRNKEETVIDGNNCF